MPGEGPIEALKRVRQGPMLGGPNASIGAKPEPSILRKALEGLTGYPADPDREMEPGDAIGQLATVLPLSKLQHSLRGLGADLIRKAKSPILRKIYSPSDFGSSDVAIIASGLRPSGYGKGGIGLAVPFQHRDTHLDEGLRTWLYENEIPTKGDIRLASEELYNISQRVLKDAGIQPGESLDVFRSGPVPKQPHALTPTHVERDIINNWHGQPAERFQVPKESVRALPGLLRRGDDVTLGEALIPSRTLQHSRVIGPLSFWDDYDPTSKLKLRDPDRILPTAATRTPSWYKKQVLK